MRTDTPASEQGPTLPDHVNRRGHGLGVCLTADRNGQPIAYRVYRDRSFRCGRLEAEIWVATGQARQLTRAQAGLGPIGPRIIGSYATRP